MRKSNIYLTGLCMFLTFAGFAQKEKTDANVIGHVICFGEHIPFASVYIKGTTIGTTTNETGHYQLFHLPEDSMVIIARALGYKPEEAVIKIHAGETREVNFELEKDVLGIKEVMITADRNARDRQESSTIVSTISPRLFSRTQSASLGEGINFCPGLRLENNCQNCGFTQVRINGMEGPYSQILINSRPVFSGLAGVYGLELIPSNMIERVEVIRGGGSALYGSNAIAGTINLILKDPINNSYEFGADARITGAGMDDSGDPAEDCNIHFNTSTISACNKTGMALYGFHRNRNPFDANDDGFSEIASINNTTVGARIYHRFQTRSKLTADFFHIREERRGGDRHDVVVHEAGIAEALDHCINSVALTYEQFFREVDMLSVYASGQRVNRDSYYGAGQSLSDYGNTRDFSFTTGAQYSAKFRISELIAGIENSGSLLTDRKLGYPDLENAGVDFTDTSIIIPHTDNVIIADQKTNRLGVFAQYEADWNKFSVSAGARFENYRITDRRQEGSDKSGSVLTPRFTLKYDMENYLQARVSYSQGYRAPQIFDEDLHIETSGSRQVFHENDPGLEAERSHSYMVSLDFNKQINTRYLGLLVEGFFTQLNQPFANEFSDPDEKGRVVYTRVNAEEGARVRGFNMEMNLVPVNAVSFRGGFTVQKSTYEEPREFGEKSFFRTPGRYGYFAMDWELSGNWIISASGSYTGPMLIPYFGLQIPDPSEGELRRSDDFFDLGLKINRNVKLNGATLQLFAGMKNIFNACQDDFDRGIDRDPGYIYGPLTPRTLYIGLKIGNFIE